jgi:hypothetical protein
MCGLQAESATNRLGDLCRGEPVVFQVFILAGSYHRILTQDSFVSNAVAPGPEEARSAVHGSAADKKLRSGDGNAAQSERRSGLPQAA